MQLLGVVKNIFSVHVVNVVMNIVDVENSTLIAVTKTTLKIFEIKRYFDILCMYNHSTTLLEVKLWLAFVVPVVFPSNFLTVTLRKKHKELVSRYFAMNTSQVCQLVKNKILRKKNVFALVSNTYLNICPSG